MEMGSAETPINETTLKTFRNETLPRQCPPLNFPKEIVLKLEVERWCLGFEFFLAIFGNICLLIALRKRKENWSRMLTYILHLGVADFLVAFCFILPVWLERMICGFHGSNGLCKFQSYMQIFSMYGSTLVLLAVAADRYMAICHPLKNLGKSRKQVHMTAAIMWAIAGILSLPQVFIFEKFQNPSCGSVLQNIPNRIYVSWYLFAILVIPTLLLTFLYGMISFTISKNAAEKKQASKGEDQALTKQRIIPRASNAEGITRAKIKTIKMTIVIVSTYIFCWTPFFVIQMMTAWNFELPKNTVTLILSSVVEILGCLNSCTNPWVYIIFSGNCCTDLNDLLFCRNKKKRKLQKGSNFELKTKYFKSQISTEGHTEHTIIASSVVVDSPASSRRIEKLNSSQLTDITRKSN